MHGMMRAGSVWAGSRIVKDFAIGLTAYDSYDSKPPAGATSKNDFGFSLTVGWTF